MSTLSLSQTVGELVRDNPARARVFETLGIDYCCGGKVLLDEACKEHNLDPEKVRGQLEALDAGAPDSAPRYATMSLTELADHIEAHHHDYLRQELPRLGMLTDRVARAHGERDPRLLRVREILASFSAEMMHHIAKEERMLFPIIRKLESGGASPAGGFGSIADPIRQMEAEHDSSGDALAQLRERTDGFTPPPGTCNTHLALLDALVALERFYARHIEFEDKTLFPAAARVLDPEQVRQIGREVAARRGLRCDGSDS